MVVSTVVWQTCIKLLSGCIYHINGLVCKCGTLLRLVCSVTMLAVSLLKLGISLLEKFLLLDYIYIKILINCLIVTFFLICKVGTFVIVLSRVWSAFCNRKLRTVSLKMPTTILSLINSPFYHPVHKHLPYLVKLRDTSENLQLFGVLLRGRCILTLIIASSLHNFLQN